MSDWAWLATCAAALVVLVMAAEADAVVHSDLPTVYELATTCRKTQVSVSRTSAAASACNTVRVVVLMCSSPRPMWHRAARSAARSNVDKARFHAGLKALRQG